MERVKADVFSASNFVHASLSLMNSVNLKLSPGPLGSRCQLLSRD